MEKYFENMCLLQNILLPYFCNAEPLKLINKKFYGLNYKKYNTHIQPHGILETYHKNSKTLEDRITYKNGKLNGLSEEYYNHGQLYCRKNYKDNELDGLSEFWNESGKLCHRCNFKDGKLYGLPEYW